MITYCLITCTTRSYLSLDLMDCNFSFNGAVIMGCMPEWCFGSNWKVLCVFEIKLPETKMGYETVANASIGPLENDSNGLTKLYRLMQRLSMVVELLLIDAAAYTNVIHHLYTAPGWVGWVTSKPWIKDKNFHSFLRNCPHVNAARPVDKSTQFQGMSCCRHYMNQYDRDLCRHMPSLSHCVLNTDH